jgi:hypothetical protein
VCTHNSRAHPPVLICKSGTLKHRKPKIKTKITSTANPCYNKIRYTGQNLAVYDCEETERHYEGFVVKNNLNKREPKYENLYVITVYVYYMYWLCFLWCISVNTLSLSYSRHWRKQTPCTLISLLQQGFTITYC